MMARSLALRILLPFLAVLLPTLDAGAVGTPAGDVISNQAFAVFVMNGSPGSVGSNVLQITVHEYIDVQVTRQTVGNVQVAPAEIDALLTYRVDNVGNGSEEFLLGVDNSAAADDFDPTLSNIYIDADPDGPGPATPDGLYDPMVDTPYNALSPPTLDANSLTGGEFITVFVLNDIPAGLSDGQLGQSALTATSNSAAGAAGGDVLIGAGDGGTDAIVALSGPSDSAFGAYEITAVSVGVTKSGNVLGPQPISGVQVEYQLDITATGSGTAVGVVITDPIPANVTYAPGSIDLNGTPMTDAADGDAADFNVTNPNQVTVTLGDITQASPQQTITFRVVID